MEEVTKEMGQFNKNKRDLLLFGRRLYYKGDDNTAEDIGTYLIVIVKTSTKIFFNEYIERLMEDWPGGSYIFKIQPSMPDERLKISTE